MLFKIGSSCWTHWNYIFENMMQNEDEVQRARPFSTAVFSYIAQWKVRT